MSGLAWLGARWYYGAIDGPCGVTRCYICASYWRRLGREALAHLEENRRKHGWAK